MMIDKFSGSGNFRIKSVFVKIHFILWNIQNNDREYWLTTVLTITYIYTLEHLHICCRGGGAVCKSVRPPPLPPAKN